ncbi:MAG: bifunctional folylpolyglutamate synthase/dihydrofolate synthase [Bacteroidaceae bacterium]|nr:bifunctional folylpolyglutamate synthase/dihydrofolate synthase [Bacteroidaceae bacterium]
MNFQQTIDYLYHAAPLFQNVGAGAYKEGLSTTRALDEHFGHPHTLYHSIHVAGTNGKGSVSSSLAAILQSAGYRVGLYTSPHLIDFRERIRVNGEMIPEQRVVDFVEQERPFFEPLHPSFFELTTALAFLYFAEQQVDVAVIEVGLGGRLDCTNIINPDLAIITNISFDHQQFLGDTLPAIAAEKAGIIKPGIPVIIGETNNHSSVRATFLRAFLSVNSSLSSASSADILSSLRFADEEPFPSVSSLPYFQLRGAYQSANLRTILCALSELRRQSFYSRITSAAITHGLAHVMELTGLRGRWQQLQEHPTLVCDAGHNAAGIQYVVSQLSEQNAPHLHIILGMVSDKDYYTAASAFIHLAAVRRSRGLLTTFYLTQPSCARALPVSDLHSAFISTFTSLTSSASPSSTASVPSALAPPPSTAVPSSSDEVSSSSLSLQSFPSVPAALSAALSAASPSDFIFVGGSCYVIADLFASLS